jgi:hypothetical protein
MGHLFPGGTKPTSGSEFRSRVIFRLMWCPLSHPPLYGGGAPLGAEGERSLKKAPTRHALRDTLPAKGEG